MLNKIDKVSKETILKKITQYKDLYDFNEIIPLSVLKKEDTDILIREIKKYLTDDIKYYIMGSEMRGNKSKYQVLFVFAV